MIRTLWYVGYVTEACDSPDPVFQSITSPDEFNWINLKNDRFYSNPDWDKIEWFTSEQAALDWAQDKTFDWALDDNERLIPVKIDLYPEEEE